MLGAQLLGLSPNLLASLAQEKPEPSAEQYWSQLRTSFFIHPTLAVFNHVGVNPPPRAVVEVQIRELRRAATDPSYVMWREQDKELDPVKEGLAKVLTCDISLTPNATYGLQTVIMGLPMEPGDEIVITNQEYPRSHTAVDQRVARDKVVKREVKLPARFLTLDEAYDLILAAVGPKTKLVVLAEVGYLLGQVMPIERIARELDRRGICFLVDGAQAIGLSTLQFSKCHSAVYVACLHKWMMGPVGTGVLVTPLAWRDRIWPLHPADESLRQSPSKYEQLGTHSTATYLALNESLKLHETIGREAKLGRLLYLRERLVSAWKGNSKVKILSSTDPRVCMPFLSVEVEGLAAGTVASKLMSEHQIHVTTVARAGLNGVRIAPNLFTSPAEMDRLIAAMLKIAG